MSYRIPINRDTPQYERQQERLAIARQALARVEAKYARKRQLKQRLKRNDERQATLAQQYVE